MTREHDNYRMYIQGSKRTYKNRDLSRSIGYIPPTLTELGVDMPKFMADNSELIACMRRGRR